ncbi:MAG TPA: hypothetical protein RMH99_02085 [Sandaracinaceae bacterium LLY-WYZ-13_1]|nr:hypothetical protein [Sandaracinaceae bacterium LLY-WYZ-13_1]
MTSTLSRLVLAALLALPALARAQPHAGREAAARYGCASCHDLPGVRVARGQDCVGCHQRVVRRAASRMGRAPRVAHYVHAPDLRHVTRRLRTDYLVGFLQDPHDVRPRLEETMPRLPVTEADARAIVGWLRASAGPVSAPASPAPRRANVARGRRVFEDAGCPACHELGNLDLGVRLPPSALAGMGRPAHEAPNLRFVRDRMDPDVALAWILDPRSVDPSTQMEDPELSREDAVAVRDFLFRVDPGAPARRRVPTTRDLTPVDRPVRFAEVRRVFQRSCIHCHAHTDGASASAFGFEPSSLDLSSLEGVRAGVVTPDGARRSILEDDATGVPPLVARLLRRHAEAPRDLSAPRRDALAPVERPRPDAPVGMPLGLPPVSVEDISLIATWIAQGARP